MVPHHIQHRETPSGAGEAPRLEIETHLDRRPPEAARAADLEGGLWVTSVRDYGAGEIEVTAMPVALAESLKTKRANRKRTARNRSEMSEADLAKCNTRARAQLRRLIMSMRADRILTLTTRECITDRRVFQSAVAKFNRMCRREFRDWACVCVFELQKRGAYHAHLAIHGFRPVKVLRRLWGRALYLTTGSPEGNIDITRGREGYMERRKISRYLGKYISKDFGRDEQMNSKRFITSGDISVPPPVKRVLVIPEGIDTIQVLVDFMTDLYGVGISEVFRAEDAPIVRLTSYG